jgi:lysophospholipase L1-like esterase
MLALEAKSATARPYDRILSESSPPVGAFYAMIRPAEESGIQEPIPFPPPARIMEQRWGRKARVGALLASTVFSLVTAEAFARRFLPLRFVEIRQENVRLSDNPRLMYELTPLSADHNRRGFRGADTTQAKKDGVYRILAMGDSVTYGLELADTKDTIPAQLETLLNEQKGPGAGEREFEVLNFGVPGYSILQEAEQLRVKGLDFAPDLVVLTVCLNDWDPASLQFQILLAEGDEAQRGFFSFYYDPANTSLERLLYRSHLFRVASYHFRRSRAFSGPAEWREVANADGLSIVERSSVVQYYSDRSFYREHFTRLSELVADREIPLIVALAPSPDDEVQEFYGTRLRELEQLCSELDCILLDLLPFLTGGGPSRVLPSAELYADGLHFNASGARRTARAIADCVDRFLKQGQAADCSHADEP